MKASRYNMTVPLSGDGIIFFNTFNRNMIFANAREANQIQQILQALHQEAFNIEDVPVIQYLNRKGFILRDQENELEAIGRIETLVKNRDDMFYIVIKPTFACNFRCSYCGQDHISQTMNDQTAEKILSFISAKAQTTKLINVTWYGGEPLLEYTRILALSKRVAEICDSLGTSYYFSIVTNAYLLPKTRIEQLIAHTFKYFQITIDGDEMHHDRARPYVDGSGTFNTVFESLVNVLTLGQERDVHVHLRVNINEDNLSGILPLLQKVPTKYRGQISLDLVNWFQNAVRLNFYDLIKSSIQLGYRYKNRKNPFAVCEASYKNVASFLPNGDAAFCSQEFDHAQCYGTIGENGEIRITNQERYNQFQELWSHSNSICSQCLRLPICMGGCKKVRLSDDQICTNGGPSGLSLEEEVMLFYLDHLQFEDPEEITYERARI